ncbi:MAG: DUF2207 domain-containing protein, partial [Microlunatus sp.]|nr:DUF2207 domain-containing protein [Microlunatus sp.]
MIVGLGLTARRFTRWALALLLTLAAALLLATARPAPAFADSSEYINSLKINYRVDTAGLLHVDETWNWHFDPASENHGMNRSLVTREPDTGQNAGKDIVYDISNFTVSSPTGAATDVKRTTVGGLFDRNRYVNYRIGNPNQLVGAQETYNISYVVKGALRTSGSYDELYWDAISSMAGSPTPEIRNLQVTTSVPGGAQAVVCYAGAARSTTPCNGDASVSGQNGIASATDVASGDIVTVGVKIKPGLISDNTPHLVRKAGLVSALLTPAVGIPALIGLVITAGIPFIGRKVAKERTTDFRYLNLAPGTVPLPGAPAEIGKSDPRMEIPVQFTPPPITVAEAGILVDGQVDVRDTAATLVELAVNGAIKIEDVDGSGYQVRLLDPGRAAGPHETALLTKIFGGQPAGAVTDLSSRGSMTEAHRALVSETRSLVQQKQWFTKVPKAAGRALGGGWFGAIVVAGWIFFHSGGAVGSVSPWLLLLILPIASLLITTVLVSRILRRGQRTADGRAVCDHVDGFKQYLATAEADQLRFEEGQDIFSRYLPWA